MKGFREAEGDLLEYLRGKCNVDADVVDLVWKPWCRDSSKRLRPPFLRRNTRCAAFT